jgi:hypothetical protein
MNNKIFYVFIFFVITIFNDSRATEHYVVIKLPLCDLIGKEQYIDLAKAEITDKIINKIFISSNVCSSKDNNQRLEQEVKFTIEDTHCVKIICEYSEDITDMQIVYDKQYANNILIASSDNLKHSKYSNMARRESSSSLVGVILNKAYDITLRRLEEFIRSVVLMPAHRNKAAIFALEVEPYKQGLNDKGDLAQLKFAIFFQHYDNTRRQFRLKQDNKPYTPELQY